MLLAMTLALGTDKQRFHWSVSEGTDDWAEYPGHHVGLNQGRIAVLECTHGHSTSYEPSGCGLHCPWHTSSNEESIKRYGLVRTSRPGQNARTSVHFAAYKQQAGVQSYHDYGLHVYLKTFELVSDGYEVTMNNNGVFHTVDDVTAEAVMVGPLYLLGIFKSWAEQMEWNDLPSRVMDRDGRLQASLRTMPVFFASS
eukprot:6169455-Amphidinium_carterae.4